VFELSPLTETKGGRYEPTRGDGTRGAGRVRGGCGDVADPGNKKTPFKGSGVNCPRIELSPRLTCGEDRDGR
jgi:hypothetical protein